MAIFPHQQHLLLVGREYEHEYALDTAGCRRYHVFAWTTPARHGSHVAQQRRRKEGVRVERVVGSPFVEHVILAKVVIAEVFKTQNLQ